MADASPAGCMAIIKTECFFLGLFDQRVSVQTFFRKYFSGELALTIVNTVSGYYYQ